MVTLNLDKIFNPRSVAIIGASDEEGTVGYALMKNFTEHGFEGKVYPVNIRKTEILGLKAYQTVEQIPDPIDLAVIATPAKKVPDVVEQCGKAGIKGIIIISAGFKEIGAEGRALEEKITEIKKQYGLRIIGPNCLGIIRPSINLNATFMNKTPKSGNIAFIIADLWQGLGLGTKMVDHVIDICKDMRIETIYGIMLPDNHRAISLMKKMGFAIKSLEDGTVKGTLKLKEEEVQCIEPKNTEQPQQQTQPEQKEQSEAEKTAA